jgi:serine/threonine protein kinase
VLARPVAVKVLCTGEPCGPGTDSEPSAGEPFLRAAAAAGRLTGTVLARVYDAASETGPAGADRRPAGCRTSSASGSTAATWPAVLREDGPLDPVTACRLTATAAEALESAHARGVVHGRLHPGNVLLLPDGRIKITDTATSAALPERGVPAQRSGDPHGPAADVRDLTAVLYALLTGRWPVGATPQPSCGVPAAPTTSDGRRRGRLTSPRQVRAGVPRSLDDLVHRVLEPSAAPGGPQTAAGLADALDAALPVERPARPTRRRPGRRSTSALVGRTGRRAARGWRVDAGRS